jgi:hypothetical protein
MEPPERDRRTPQGIGCFGTLRHATRTLRRAVHAHRWAVAVLMACLSVGHLASAVQREEDVLRARTVVAEKYELRGRNGKPSAMLYQNAPGQARLVFLDDAGGLRLSVGMDPGGEPGITLFNQQNKPQLSMSIDSKKKSPQLHLFDDRGNSTISIGVDQETGAAIWIGKAERGRISMGVNLHGEPSVLLWGKDNTPRLSLAVIDDCPVITLLDDTKVVRTRWKVLRNGTPMFSLLDERGRDRLVMGVDTEDRPFIRVTDPKTKDSKLIQ